MKYESWYRHGHKERMAACDRRVLERKRKQEIDRRKSQGIVMALLGIIASTFAWLIS